MNTPYIPRVKNIDVAFVADRREDFLRARATAEQRIRDEPDKLLQVKLNSVRTDLEHIGYYEFALGYPVENVRQTFREAAATAVKVFELHGTEEAFPVVVMTVNPARPQDEPGFRPLHPPGTKDYSMTNSRTCFEAICMAFIAGEHATARRLAELMWDPPRANYIGPRSEVCTNSQQRLAYALKALLLDQMSGIAKELGHIVDRKGEQQVAASAKMIRGLAESNDAVFGEGLLELLFFHRKWARRPENNTDPTRFFSLTAVGLSILAIQRGVLTKTALPVDDYLPLWL